MGPLKVWLDWGCSRYSSTKPFRVASCLYSPALQHFDCHYTAPVPQVVLATSCDCQSGQLCQAALYCRVCNAPKQLPIPSGQCRNAACMCDAGCVQNPENNHSCPRTAKSLYYFRPVVQAWLDSMCHKFDISDTTIMLLAPCCEHAWG